ncbi:hypothetical protein HMPREF9120_00405 [Neisseria sp. oral taxon 020 str. F0370]|nr:hypothetical protein HMPREF9120_00405 [Neisseria sp. oral taxon 020 str. F0370]
MIQAGERPSENVSDGLSPPRPVRNTVRIPPPKPRRRFSDGLRTPKAV